MNSWDPDNAYCEAEQDDYDPDQEVIASFSGFDKGLGDLAIGQWRDVFCVRNELYYEAEVVDMKFPSTKKVAGGGVVAAEECDVNMVGGLPADSSASSAVVADVAGSECSSTMAKTKRKKGAKGWGGRKKIVGRLKKAKARFHFKGWPSNFDEWLDIDRFVLNSNLL